MSDFGWAFVKSGLLTSSAPPAKSLQFSNHKGGLQGNECLTFDCDDEIALNLTGTLNVSGAINANQYNVNVVNKTVTNLAADGSTKFGDSMGDFHIFTGSMSITATTNPIKVYGLQNAPGRDTLSYLTLDSNYNLVLTAAIDTRLGGTIGTAEDGTYTDGLFPEFVANTTIGTAIDKFNEILKIIVPGPAPSVDRINYTNNAGFGSKLSINAGSKPGNYTAVGNTGSYSDSLTKNSQYSVSTSGEDFRLGVYDGTQEITGVINYNTAEQLKSTQVNYSTDAFGNAESGLLKLYVNGALKHTLNLTASGAGNPNTGSASDLNNNGSGFFALSKAADARDQNGSLYDIFKHRTSQYVVDPTDQRRGWNIAKVEHEFGTTTYITNFVQWFNDTDANNDAMSVSNNRITVVGTGAKYLSGVKYFTGANVTYNADVANAYKHTYPDGDVVSFRQTNLNGASPIPLPAIGASENYNKILQITQSSTNSTSTMLGTTFARSINLEHPFKTNLSAAGNSTSSPTLIYNVSNASSNLLEKFDDETFRIASKAYATQNSVTSVGATWHSGSHMTGSGLEGHTDGLMFFNSNLYSPKNTPVGGITNGAFAPLGDGPTGNPNYSDQSGTRTFYRKVQNTTGGTIRDLKISSDKSTKINNSSLSTDNIQFYIKLPGTSGWMDISQNFSYGSIADGNGALINGASGSANTESADSGDSVHCVTFGTASVANNEYVVVMILASTNWTSYVENLTFQLGASDAPAPTQADTLDNIDLDDDAGETAKLSFGSSNGIVGYSNVAGGVGSLPAVNSNALYADNEATNRGVFKALEVMGGTLNEDVTSDGDNHPADSFNNAFTGSLLLVVNGVTVSTLNLANLSSNNNLSSDTGFSVGAVGFSTTTDAIPDYTKPYRTGTYSIGTGAQRSGWNHARVIHRIGASDTLTNYVQWVVDPSGSADNTAVSAPTLSNFNHSNIYHQSGVKYFASNPSASFSFVGSNFYSNVYSSDSAAISFPVTTNCDITNIRAIGSGITTYDSGVAFAELPVLDNSADCEMTSIQITGTVQYNVVSAMPSISGGLGIFNKYDATVTGRLLHPLKADRTTASRSKVSFMVYSGLNGNTNLTTEEYFNTEAHRIVSGNYENQAAIISNENTWNSQTALNGNNAHGDGMVTSNGFAISPLKIGNNGDTRNTADGGTLQAPAGSPNYSTLSANVRTYYRMFRYTGASTVASFAMTLYGDATLVSKDNVSPYYAALGANNRCNVEFKVAYDPNFSGADDQSTGWADAAKIFDSSDQPNNNGSGIRSGASIGEDVSIDSNGLALSLTLGTRRIKQNQYYIVKVSAHKNWTGYLSRIKVTY